MRATKIRNSAGFLAGSVLVLSLAACGNSTPDTVVQVPSIAVPNGLTSAQTTSLILALLPTALAQQGISRQTFCAGVRLESDALIDQQFMVGFNQAGAGVSIDSTAVAPAVRSWCADAV